MKYYLYKITNLINNKIYIGVHKTKDLDDGYMGSGKRLQIAIQKYGIENFEKEVLKFFENETDMFAAEANVVTEEFIQRDDTYNLKTGGFGGWDYVNSLDFERGGWKHINDLGINKNTVMVKDDDENIFRVSRDDERFISGRLKPFNIDTVLARAKDSSSLIVVPKEEFDKSEDLVGYTYGKTLVRRKGTDEKYFYVDKDDPRIGNEFETRTKGFVNVINPDTGEVMNISCQDPKYLAGEYVHMNKGKTLTEEHKQKISDSFKQRKSQGLKAKERSVQRTPGYKWMHNEITKENKCVHPDKIDEHIKFGWLIGRYKG